ncbi:hypothetical protein VTI28DRAFT_6228 [Corynascus sepedonium]
MRASLVSKLGRAATYLCAACRREVTSTLAPRGAASRVASVAQPHRTLQTLPSPVLRGTPALRRSPATTHSRSNSTSTSPSSTSSSQSPPSESPIPTYYALFSETLPDGPPPKGKFAIDLRTLRNEFLRLQAASHPDFHHSAASETGPGSETNKNNNKSPARLRAEATSALINAAYKTLSSPLLRAQYILHEQYGVDLEGDEQGTQSRADPELLMTVLEAREAIEEAEREEDLEEVRAANEARVSESERRLGEALEAGDVPAAVDEAVRLRYWLNIRQGIDGWERGKPVVLQH